MKVEKRSSKGGFFQLFDWKAKSRKKLFSNKSQVSEVSDQEKEILDRAAISRLPQMKLHENGPSPSVRGSDYSCVSSVSSDEGCGTRAPGVVARLMGLDSLPTSDVSESYSTPFFDSQSFRDSHLARTCSDIQSEHHIMDYGNTRNKLDGFSRNPVELRLQKLQNRPIERFQSEVLPPKSARSISITHHKLLSPIKSPGFILTKNAACIMEAASKIIEQSPRSISKSKLPSFGSPSVPLRIRDLKEKLEAAQNASGVPEASLRLKENHVVTYMNGQNSDRSRRGSQDSLLLKSSLIPEKGGLCILENNGKSPSLANQAKTNVKKREGPVSSGNRSSIKQKGEDGAKSSHFDKSQPYLQKNVQKRTPGRKTPDVLTQNNQKQNCASSKEGVSLKQHHTASTQQDRKGLSTNSSSRVNKTSNKGVENSSTCTRKTNLAADTRKEHSSSTSKSLSGKKRSVNGNVHFNGSVTGDVLINKNERSVKCNISLDECANWDAVDGKNGMDIVSFTFTSPIKKSVPGSQLSSRQVMEKNSSLSVDAGDQSSSHATYLSSLGLNVIDRDALSVLLEQKLKELACKVESSDFNIVKEGYFRSYASTMEDSIQPLNVDASASTIHDKMLKLDFPRDKSGNQNESDPSSLDELLPDAKQRWQEFRELGETSSSNCCNNNSVYGNELNFRYPCPSSSQPPLSGGSCNFSDSKTGFTTNGGWQCLSAEAQEMVSWISARKPQFVEDATELSDSTSSLSIGGTETKDIASTSSFTNFDTSSHWELKYVKGVLSNAELNVEDFVLSQANEVIAPDLFDHLENQKTLSVKTTEECLKFERKLLFDYTSACLDFRCEQISGGSYKAWVKWTRLLQRKEMLAEELYKEICSSTSMKDLMVDELVEKDMSTQYGKWIDFETEELEEGLEIEKAILTSLVDELVTDLFS